jgi:hypothetical protein
LEPPTFFTTSATKGEITGTTASPRSSLVGNEEEPTPGT